MQLYLLIPIAEGIVILTAVIYLLCKYADRKRTPAFVYFVVGLGWFMGFSMLFIIPIDIYYSITTQSVDQNLVWYFRVFYWGSTILNWCVLPFTASYLESGQFTKKGKALQALKDQIPMVLVGAVAGVALILYLYLSPLGK